MTGIVTGKLEESLLAAQKKAEFLFEQVQELNIIRPGQTERQVSDEIYQLAHKLFGIRKYWHKRVVRAGVNTLLPYRENPPNLMIKDGDLIFLDFGPIFAQWEADFGRTYQLGDDPCKQKLIEDLERVFQQSKQYYRNNPGIAGSELFSDVVKRSKAHGWEYGGPHAGHLIGVFPHEMRCGENSDNYICPENSVPMNALDKNGEVRHWILEVHLIDRERQYGGFYEELLTLDRNW
jgi:Xaa-Pro dipeptidase